METKHSKRNKLWRKQKSQKLFKSRMMLFAASNTILWDEDGNVIQHPHWFQFAKDRCFMAYKTTSTPCSCWLCKGERYNRAKSRRGRSKK